jgi:hypothetical protein
MSYSLSNGKQNVPVTEAWNTFTVTAPYDANGTALDEGYGEFLDYDGEPDNHPID